jgi:hypothetical protein
VSTFSFALPLHLVGHEDFLKQKSLLYTLLPAS